MNMLLVQPRAKPFLDIYMLGLYVMILIRIGFRGDTLVGLDIADYE